MREIQDLYDVNRRPTGEQIFRGDPIPADRYRLGVQVWLRNDKGQLLLTQRHPCKKLPLLWEPTGGAVMAGEDTRTAGIRELREEIGVCLRKEQLCPVRSLLCDGIEFLDTYMADWNGSISELTLQDTEVVDARWVDSAELIAMDRQGLLACEYAYLFDSPND